MSGFSDIFGGYGSSLGGLYGQQQTEGEKQEILKLLKDQFGDANRLDPSSLGQTAFSGISTDPRTRAAQMEALNSLRGVANAQGLDPQAQAMQAEADREAAGFEQSQRQALQQSMAARGMGGSGAEVAGLLSAQQEGANRSHQGAMQAASDARTRALAAMTGVGQLGGQIHAQDYQEAADKARATDAAKQNAYQGQLAKLQAMGQGRAGLANFFGADRAEQIGNATAAGGAIGGGVGGLADFGTSYATGGMAKPKALDAGADAYPDLKKTNPWGGWGMP